ncbi:MAG: uroporphyrinogen decarboxylase family protein [Anaerolineae bacterium]
MQSRERLLAALRHRPVDHIPWTGLITNFYLRSLPPALGLRSPKDVLQCVGADVLDIGFTDLRRSGPRGLCESMSGVERVQQLAGDLVTSTLATPVGSVTERSRVDPVTGTSRRTKYFVQSPQDCRVMQYVCEHTAYTPDYAPLQQVVDGLDGDGLLAYWAPRSPLPMLLEEWAGLEAGIFLLADHLESTEGLLHAIHERNQRAFGLLADSPAEFVVSVEDTSSTMISPKLFEAYVLPYLNDYAEILHRRGKIHGAHMCGHLSQLLPAIGRLQLDGIESVTPFPTGDTELPDAQRALAGKFVIGGLDAPSVLRKTPGEIRSWAKDILAQLPSREGVILEVADDVTYDTPLENLRAIGEAIEEYG